ncbi:unnamed protein product [Diatraea saccharalis]|uniref:Uncharacterized protein n=1 Tax=Diatraea saccharalis TaxID=40085 RepID=A0A9N9WCK6_9NEOP|nr:unnamed protein product [Diatraea saccharalis]
MSRDAASSGSDRTVDVIDLGAPRELRDAGPRPPPAARAPRLYTPNPRLVARVEAGAFSDDRCRTRDCTGRRRAACPRPPPPGGRGPRPRPRCPSRTPRRGRPTAWPPGAAPPPARRPRARPRPRPPLRPSPRRSRHLVVTLPPAVASAMDSNYRHSTSPEDCSDGNDNDAVSAPSEFLAEFLSAIMQRQYSEALKYCRLILQYEPHNATARGFYPLLQHKWVVRGRRGRRGRSSASATAAGRRPPRARRPARTRTRAADIDIARTLTRPTPDPYVTELILARLSRHLEDGGGWSAGSESWGGSGASQSSLELDSSSGDRSGDRTASSTRDNNGNEPPPHHVTTDDLENDNDVSAPTTFHRPKWKACVTICAGDIVRRGGSAEAAASTLRLLHQVKPSAADAFARTRRLVPDPTGGSADRE